MKTGQLPSGLAPGEGGAVVGRQAPAHSLPSAQRVRAPLPAVGARPASVGALYCEGRSVCTRGAGLRGQ